MAATQVDLLREYVKLKQSYYAKGYPKAKVSIASPGMLVNDVYPVLLRKDVALLSGTFIRWIYADPFQPTASFTRAQNDFLLYGLQGMKSLSTALVSLISYKQTAQLSAFTQSLYANGVADLPYPYSEAFWGYLKLLAIARGGAGLVLSPFQIAVEALKESMPKFPDFPCIKMSCLVPGWVVPVSLAAGGLWLVLKLKKKDGS